MADAASGSDVALVLATFSWVAASGLFRAAGPTGAIVGFATSAHAGRLRRAADHNSARPEAALVRGGCRPGSAADDRSARRRLRLDAGVAGRRSRSPRPRALVARRPAAVAVSAGTLVYRLADLAHGYWIPLTTLAVLQPGPHATDVRSIQRAAGTLVAAVLVITHHGPDGKALAARRVRRRDGVPPSTRFASVGTSGWS